MIAPAHEMAVNAYTLKVASRCNLNCTYCYVYNKEDTSWLRRPTIMSDAVFDRTLERIAEHGRRTGQSSVRLTFHGGEPTLVGLQRMEDWCDAAQRRLAGFDRVAFSIQTNATRITPAWVDLFLRRKFNVGVSLDGPPELNDRARLNRGGRGTYHLTVRGIDLLASGGVPFGILCVIPLGEDPVAVHRHFVGLGPGAISYLMPDHTHDTVALARRVSPTPVADFLIGVFEDWWNSTDVDLQVRPLIEMARMILGGASRMDAFGNEALRFLFVETDGDIEGLDVLKICEDGLASTGCNVETHAIAEVAGSETVAARLAFQGAELPSSCRGCPEAATCGGGYPPHRYRRGAGFDHSSAWCADLKAVFRHLRDRLEVEPEETLRRAEVLRRFAEEDRAVA